MKLCLTLPMPPTTNNAYPTNRQGRRTLSTEGQRYKAIAALLARSGASEQRWQYVDGQRLGLSLRLHFSNKQRCDLSNRIKLVEDAIAEALQFDDRVIDDLHLVRGAVDKMNPRCEIELWALVPVEEVAA